MSCLDSAQIVGKPEVIAFGRVRKGPSSSGSCSADFTSARWAILAVPKRHRFDAAETSQNPTYGPLGRIQVSKTIFSPYLLRRVLRELKSVQRLTPLASGNVCRESSGPMGRDANGPAGLAMRRCSHLSANATWCATIGRLARPISAQDRVRNRRRERPAGGAPLSAPPVQGDGGVTYLAGVPDQADRAA